MNYSHPKKYRILTWIPDDKGIFFWSFDNRSAFKRNIEYQIENEFHADQIKSKFCGKLDFPCFGENTGHKKIAWFMVCYDAGGFIIMSLIPAFLPYFYRLKTKSFLHRHFITAPLKTYDDRKFLVARFFHGSKRPL